MLLTFCGTRGSTPTPRQQFRGDGWTDHSPTAFGPGADGVGVLHDAALDLATGADVLIHGGQYLVAEFPALEYLGHACVEYVVALAVAARVATLVLFHHSLDRTDTQLDGVLRHTRDVARELDPGLAVVAATDNWQLRVAHRT